MNLTSLGILSASVVVGVVGAGAAYQLTSVDAQEQASASVPAAPATQATQPRTRWAPCNPPAALEGKECIVDVTRTVTLPAEPAAAAPMPASAPAPAPAAKPAPVRAPAASTTGPGADGPGTHESQVAGTAPGDDCDVRDDRDADRDDCDDRNHDTSGGDHDDSTEDARDDAADAAEDAADAAADAAEDAEDD